MRRWTTVFVVALLATCGAKKGKRGKRGKAAEVEAPPALPGPLATVHPTARPPLGTVGGGLDITVMKRTQTRFAFDADVSFLGDLPADHQEALLHTLAADPRWRVHATDTGTVAALRGEDLSVHASGYNLDADSTWAAIVRSDGAPHWKGADLTRVPHDGGRFEVEGAPLADGPFAGAVSSVFELTAPAVNLGLHEVSGRGRPGTTAAILDIERSLDIAVSTADLVATDGVRGMYLPKGEPASSGSLKLTSPGEGLIEVRARVATPDWGWTWLRLLVDGEPWEEETVGAATREMVGSDGDGAFFYLQSTFHVPPGKAMPATAELWFEGPGGETVQVARHEVTVPAR